MSSWSVCSDTPSNSFSVTVDDHDMILASAVGSEELLFLDCTLAASASLSKVLR